MTKQLNKEQVSQWQKNDVTAGLKDAIVERMDGIMGEIVESGDPAYDAMLKGMIRAFREVLVWEPETTESDDEIHT